MGLLDNLRNLAQGAGLGEAASGIQSLESAAQFVLPQEMSNLEQSSQLISDKITTLEQLLPTDATQVAEIGQVRTLLMDHYRHIRSGGNPAPDAITSTRIKAMPQYSKVVSEFPALHTRLATLETQYLGCSFGYQLPDGTISPPDLTWSEEQWQQIIQQSLHQTPRCWLNADRSQYAG